MSLLAKRLTGFPPFLSPCQRPSAAVTVSYIPAILAMAGKLTACPQALAKASVSNLDQAYSEAGYGQHMSLLNCLAVRSRARFVSESPSANVGVSARNIFTSEHIRSPDFFHASLCRSHSNAASDLRRDYRVSCNGSLAEPAERRTVDKLVDVQHSRLPDIEEEASLDERAENGGAQSREWAALGLSPALIARLRAVGLASATDVQMAAIPTLLNGTSRLPFAHKNIATWVAELEPLKQFVPIVHHRDSHKDSHSFSSYSDRSRCCPPVLHRLWQNPSFPSTHLVPNWASGITSSRRARGRFEGRIQRGPGAHCGAI